MSEFGYSLVIRSYDLSGRVHSWSLRDMDGIGKIYVAPWIVDPRRQHSGFVHMLPK